MTFLDDLAAADPVREEAPYGDVRGAALVADITSGRIAAPPPPPVPSRRPWLVGGIAVAAAATLAGVLIIPPVLRHDAQVSPGLPVPTSSATPTRAATPTSSTQYWKTISSGIVLSGAVSASDGASATFQVPFASTVYTPVDKTRSSFQVYDAAAGTLLTGSHEFPLPLARHQVLARPAQTRTSASPGSWQTPGPGWIAQLPRDVVSLRASLYTDWIAGSPTPDANAFDAAVQALQSDELPADLRVAIIQVIATIPGARVAPAPVDTGEVSGVGLTFEGTAFVGGTVTCAQRREVVLDPGRGTAYLDHTVLSATCAGIPQGTVLKESKVTQHELIDEVPADIVGQTNNPCDPTRWTNGGPSGCDLGRSVPGATVTQSSPLTPPMPPPGS